MRAFGTLVDLSNTPIPNGLIQFVATATTLKVMRGSYVCIKADADAKYDFELLPCSYEIYAQPSRCSDLVYMGDAVITIDTPDSTLNEIIGTSNPVLPPQLEAILLATKEAKEAAQAASESEGNAELYAQNAKIEADTSKEKAEESKIQATEATKQAQIAVSAANKAQENSNLSNEILSNIEEISIEAAEKLQQSILISDNIIQIKEEIDGARGEILAAKDAVILAESKVKKNLELTEKHAKQATEQAEISTQKADEAKSAARAAKEIADELTSLKLDMEIQDYSIKADELSNVSNAIYSSLPQKIFANIQRGKLTQIHDIFIPNPNINYAVYVETSKISFGFYQSITIIPDDASDPVTLTRAGTSFETARWITQRSSNAVQSNAFDSVFVRGSVFAVGDVTCVTEHELEDLINANK